MIVGKTSSTLTIQELFRRFGETDILTTVFPQITCLPCLICSPLRNDNHPSFSLFLNNGNHVMFKDFADNSKGGLMDLLCAYWGCGIKEAIDKILSLFTTRRSIEIKPLHITSSKNACTANADVDIQVRVRQWKDYDIEYWKGYGIDKWALKYAEVYPISHKIVTHKESGSVGVYPADKLAYCFVERKEGKVTLKIYQPYSKKYKWCSKMNGSVVGLWTKIPEFGERVIICSSLKDALCVYCQLNIPTLCLQGEGYGISDTAIRELKRRYRKVFVSLDTDKAGIENGKRLANATGFTNIIPDLGDQKDYSDYYKSLENKEDFKKLKELFD